MFRYEISLKKSIAAEFQSFGRESRTNITYYCDFYSLFSPPPSDLSRGNIVFCGNNNNNNNAIRVCPRAGTETIRVELKPRRRRARITYLPVSEAAQPGSSRKCTVTYISYRPSLHYRCTFDYLSLKSVRV